MGTLRDFLEEDLSRFEIEYRVHATRRMFEREIFNQDIEKALESGGIIERYDEDLPLRRMLINGRSRQRPLHVVLVANLNEKRLTILTVYEPDARQWTSNFSRRKPYDFGKSYKST